MNISIPIEILTKKIARNKTDSVFYAGKNIARLKLGIREYVLTTAGYYKFSLEEGGKIYEYEPGSEIPKDFARARAKLTDRKLIAINDLNLMPNWGWFSINLWIDGECPACAEDAYSTYDEAMKAFVEFINKDLRQQPRMPHRIGLHFAHFSPGGK